MLLYFAGFPTYFLMTPSHAEEIGHSSSSAAFLVSLCGVSELVGRLAAGFVADLRIIPSSILMAVMFFVGAVSSVITPFIKDYIPLAALSFVYAMFIGPVMVMNPVIIAENFGVEKLSSGLGIMGLFMGAGMICSGPIAGKRKLKNVRKCPFLFKYSIIQKSLYFIYNVSLRPEFLDPASAYVPRILILLMCQWVQNQGGHVRDPLKIGPVKDDRLDRDFMLLAPPFPTEFLVLVFFCLPNIVFVSILSLSIAGTLRDVTGNWKASYYYCSATLVVATVVMILSQFNFTRNKDKISHKHYQIETQDTNQ